MSNQRNAGPSRPPAATPFDDTSHLKQQRAILTRGRILNAAAEAFAAQGFPQVTIKDIADRAEMTKGAVYFHFPNKEALALAVTEEFYRRLQERAQTVLEKGDPYSPATVADLLMSLAHAFHDDMFVHAGSRMQLERSYIKAEMPTPYVGMLGIVTDLLQKCGEAGHLPDGTDPDALARVVVSAVFGAQHISWVLNDRADVVERIEEILAAFLPRA